MRWGAFNKLIEVIIIALFYYADVILETQVLRNGALCWFLICEGSSIVENCVVLKVPLPTGLEKILQQLKKTVSINFTDMARKIIDDKTAQEEAKVVEEPKEELDYISTYDPSTENQTTDTTPAADNSVFTPEMAGLQQASEQIVKIDPDKLGGDIKAHKEQKKGTERIKLDRMEVISGKKIAWTAYILFFIPLLFKKTNRFVRIHANEGLELNIMEIISGLMVGQYFLLPKLMETMSSTWSMVSFVICMVGAGLLGACVLTCIIALIASLFGNQNQTPWLWKRRMIHVPTERTAD